MENRIVTLGVLVALVVLVASSAFFTVKEYEQAIKFKFGEFSGEPIGPGLHFKMPWVNTVKKFDTRIQTLDSNPEEYLTTKNRTLIIDSFVKWRINNVKQYLVSVQGNLSEAKARLAQLANNGLRDEVGKRTIADVVSAERSVIMDAVLKSIAKEAEQFGIEIIDVRLKRVDYSDKIRNAVFRDMESERNVLVQTKESTGLKIAQEIRAKADATALITVAEAEKQADILRGEGDAEVTRIYAEAYGADIEFYQLYRSLQAYKETFSNQGDIMVIEPDSEFFKYFKKVK